MSDVYLFNGNSGITKNVMTDIEYDDNKKPFYNLTLYAATKDQNKDKWYKGVRAKPYFLWNKYQCKSRAFSEIVTDDIEEKDITDKLRKQGNNNIKAKCGNIKRKIQQNLGFYDEIEELEAVFKMMF